MKGKILLLCAFFIVVLLVFDISIPGGNLWSLATERAYVIPKESSVWTFTATVMNEGSGDWWIYGEDANNYYHYIGGEKESYRWVSREETQAWKGFDAHDSTTWRRWAAHLGH